MEEEQKHHHISSIVAWIGTAFIAILGTLLHFIYEWSGSFLLGSISAINESTWEHLKIAVIPILIWGIVEYVVGKKYQERLVTWGSILSKIITVTLVIIIGFYGYVAIFQEHSFVYDIILFYLAIMVAQSVGKKEAKKEDTKGKVWLSKALVIAIFILFVISSYLPPKLFLFQDGVTHRYGIFEYEYKGG